MNSYAIPVYCKHLNSVKFNIFFYNGVFTKLHALFLNVVFRMEGHMPPAPHPCNLTRPQTLSMHSGW